MNSICLNCLWKLSLLKYSVCTTIFIIWSSSVWNKENAKLENCEFDEQSELPLKGCHLSNI